MITPVAPVVAILPRRVALPRCPKCGALHATATCPRESVKVEKKGWVA